MQVLRQYRIERANGLEFVVCEVYRPHTWTQTEYDAWQQWKGDHQADDPGFSQDDFKSALKQFLDSELPDLANTFYGLRDMIPLYELLPSVVVRGLILDNKVAELYVSFDRASLYPEVQDEINRFFAIFDKHWRNMIACQRDSYGSLFDSDND